MQRCDNKDYVFANPALMVPKAKNSRRKRFNNKHTKSLATDSYASTLKRNSIYNIIQSTPKSGALNSNIAQNHSTDEFNRFSGQDKNSLQGVSHDQSENKN